MSPGTAALATGIVVVLGRWADGKELSMKILVGAVMLAIFLTIMAESNQKLASEFGMLILVGALLVNGQPLFKQLATITGQPGAAGKATK